MNTAALSAGIRSPFLASLPAQHSLPQAAAATASEVPAQADAVTLGTTSISSESDVPQVLSGTALRLGTAVAIGLSMWGALSPAMAATPTPAAPLALTQSTSRGLEAVPQAQPGAAQAQPTTATVELSRNVRKMKTEIDAVIAQPQGFDKVMEAFGQGREGNCSAVAVIKAAMKHYGSSALAQVVAVPEGYEVTTRTGFKTTITFEDLELTSQLDHFSTSDARMSAYATLSYATMSKAAMLFQLNNADGFKEALMKLGQPQSVQMDARLLGVANDLKPIPVALTEPAYPGYDAVIGASYNHAVFVSESEPGSHRHLSDHYGGAYRYNATDTNHHALNEAWGYQTTTPAPPLAR